MPRPPSPRTTDSLLHGRLVLHQPGLGSRVNLDAVLLAAFAAGCGPPPGRRSGAPPFRRAADLGAGTGAVALLLAYANVADYVLAVEIQPELARLLRDNVIANEMGARIGTLEHDLRRPPPRDLARGFDLIVANPPYLRPADGRISPHPLRAAARHEILGGLPEFLAAARALAAPNARLALAYAWRRRSSALTRLADAGFAPVRERRHPPAEGSAPATFCIEAVALDAAEPTATDARDGAAAGANDRRLDGSWPVEEVILHGRPGRYSETVERFLDGDYSSAPRIIDAGTAPSRTME